MGIYTSSSDIYLAKTLQKERQDSNSKNKKGAEGKKPTTTKSYLLPVVVLISPRLKLYGHAVQNHPGD